MEHFKGQFVHVISDASLDILLQYLDTGTDLLKYLEKKEALFSGDRGVRSAGEEETLAWYSTTLDLDGSHGFNVPDHIKSIAIVEGRFAELALSKGRMSQVQANKSSYIWDRLIQHLFEQFDYEANRRQSWASSIAPIDVYYWFARESRTRRRLLADSLIGFWERARSLERVTRVVGPSYPGDPYWLFLSLVRPAHLELDEYRKFRAELLVRYTYVLRFLRPEASDVTGTAVGV